MNSRSILGETNPYTHDYKPGDIVIVTRGPFRGQEAQITAICYKTVELGWPKEELFRRFSKKVERLWFRPENIRRACQHCCCCLLVVATEKEGKVLPAFIRGGIAGGVAVMVGIGLHQIGAGDMLSAGVAAALYLFLAFSPLERRGP